MLNDAAKREPGSRSIRSKPLGRITASGNGSSPAWTAATVAEGSSWRAGWGPRKPAVRLLWGALSTSRTRGPGWDNAPARCRQVLVLPTPPLRLTAAITGIKSPPRAVRPRTRRGLARGVYRPAGGGPHQGKGLGL